MDGDPRVESELDSFSRVLPLPYRVAIILVCGISTSMSGYDSVLTSIQEYGHGA